MSEQQQSRISIMNFGQLVGQDERQFQMDNTWGPITPEKPLLIRLNPVSGWPVNQMRRANYQEFPVPGSGYMEEMLLHYRGPDLNSHLTRHTDRTGEYNSLNSNSANRNSVLNHIAGSYTHQAQHYESNALNSNTLEFLLTKNATDIASANRNLDASINMAARNPQLPNFFPQVSGVNDSYTGLQRCNIYSASNMYNEANRLLIPNRNSYFNGSSSNSLLNNDIHSSVSNQLKDILSERPCGDFYPNYNLNYVPIGEADTMASFANSLQSIPKTMDQLKFVDSQFYMIPDYTLAESTSQERQQQELVSSTENGIQEYCDGLLQQIVDSSSAPILTAYGDQKGSDSNICDKVSDLGFDLNKTPEQKAPKRRKHRPKVVVEAKPRKNPKAATQKTQTKENQCKKRKNIPNTVATPEVDVIKETCDSTVATRQSCRKALNFDLEMLGGENSALLISQEDELTVESQHRDTDDLTFHLNEKLTNTVSSERKSIIASSATTEEQKRAKSPVNEKVPAQGNSDLHKEGNSGCVQQHIHAKDIGKILFQSETRFENSQKTQELTCENTLQLLPNIFSNSPKAKRSKRKYRNSTENHHDSATNPLGTSLFQEILQDGNFKGAELGKGLIKNQKRKRTQNSLNTKVHGRSSCPTMSKEDSQKARIKNQNGFQAHSNDETPDCCVESNKIVDQHGASTGDCFAIIGEPHQTYSTLIDEITCRLNNLDLKERNISDMEGQRALVPYKGDGSLVPYQEPGFIKKHKPRPKVDLDPETERTWKLLMGKESSEGDERTDKEKEKWWEEERNVFRGRADSFIARMHLVQGDRRFSKWKGSVVDSVIGVFLTQNVSDHLSSSAFMSLAARFPLQSKSSKRSYDVVVNTLFEEPELCIINPADSIISYGRGTLNQPAYHLDFETPHHSRELWRDIEATRTKGSLLKPDNQSLEDEFLSSQDSLDSSITQDTRIRSSSGSNSESEVFNSRHEPNKTRFLTTTNCLQVGKTTMFQDFYNSINGVSLFEERAKDGRLLHQAEHMKQNSRVVRNNGSNFHSASCHPSNFGYPQMQPPVVPSIDKELHNSHAQELQKLQINGEEVSLSETVSLHSQFQDNSMRFGLSIGDSADKPTGTQFGNGTLRSAELPTMSPYDPLSKHLVLLQDTCQSRSHTNYDQTSPNHHCVGQKTIQAESWSYTELLNTSQVLNGGQGDAVNDSSNIPVHAEGPDSEKTISAANWQVCPGNGGAEPKAQKLLYSAAPRDKESNLKVSKARKTKSETQKNHASDWDQLRKEVLVNGTKTERSKDTMDSLDYEAVRCASVKEISDAIKERGMNNMLAERIKEFLNRLVTEHGSIDLEWLRHVPPDKVKEYLLSIRGLGLKSVECVRLLTLHHLAFPVDTNVGRIAVRLGWVPLQPLPETLQLHLLELYPVLESIQKYLWPRLCKLDQRTLYELHYQMITFGKVFCTKNKPNCNSCPMRAECRHFASAFASARLALPGPEEKHIISTPVLIAAERNPSANTNPMILPLPENNLIRDAGPSSGQCEPIIEEPATPEQQRIEPLESDIEDFGEDPDDIPTIDLNSKEYGMYEQYRVQEYKEHCEGDMSKALVALTPLSASIPTPKLKNVSRLRTEHQVYELPDSHPLLEKMDKREPDDPSPYLLAIWTPGETANSIEPPERRCASHDSTNLCEDKTCFSCNSIKEANSQTVRGTLLIPCRTATRGSFPLNGTYFQVNEVFADHASSTQPIDIPRSWIWNLPRRTVYFGTSVSSIFKGLSTQQIQHCFWRGFVCVRGFDQQIRAPRPLLARLHFPASKLTKAKK